MPIRYVAFSFIVIVIIFGGFIVYSLSTSMQIIQD